MRALIAWSGGKDGALALARVRERPEVEVVGLLTTFSAALGRVSMHGVRRALVADQAEALGLPLVEVDVPGAGDGRRFAAFPPNERYEEAVRTALEEARRRGVGGVVFGDLFLADLKEYRERLLAPTGLAPLFPLWGEETAGLAREVLARGIEAFVVAVDSRHLGPSWLGRPLDRSFFAELTPGVDPCGERGEFHTFVTHGPGFRFAVAAVPGERAFEDPFWFQDLHSAERLQGEG